MSIRINPSILSADFANLQAELQTMVTRLQEVTPLPLDLHLMIENPDRWAPVFAETGAFSVTFHVEAAEHPVTIARTLRSMGARAGLAIKPNTDVEQYLEILPEFDQLLVMTVEPGFGGQALIEHTLAKVATARRRIDAEKLDVWLQVDGGIDATNIERVAELGADTFVAGSAVFKADDRATQIELLRNKASQGASHRH
jgi:ribulose-phosphate 3-epimerase